MTGVTTVGAAAAPRADGREVVAFGAVAVSFDGAVAGVAGWPLSRWYCSTAASRTVLSVVRTGEPLGFMAKSRTAIKPATTTKTTPICASLAIPQFPPV